MHTPHLLINFLFTDADAADAVTSATPAGEELPHWDMTVVYPSLQSPEFEAGFSHAVASISEMQTLFDDKNIRGLDTPPSVDAVLVADFEAAASKFNAVLTELRVVRGYIAAFVSTDSRNELAQAKYSEMRSASLPLSLLSTRFTAWLGSLDVDALIAKSQIASDHAYYLHEAKIVATHILPPGEEELSADLSLSGGGAWAKLHGDLTSQIMVSLNGEDLPMSVIRALASDPDASVRRAAYEAEIAAWEKNALPLCAAMNSIKHESNVMAARRKWGTPLDSALFGNHIDRPTLDAMLSAARKSFPDFRRYFRAKAALVSGSEKLGWYDLFAPVGETKQTWNWAEAEEFVAHQFGTYSSKMRDFALRAFGEKWIDAHPRPGKRDGAFCMGLRADESRIMQNYKPAFSGVSTLAHELGHGYHNLCLADRTPMQSGTPMTLAETASIFCETIIRQAALKNSNDDAEKLAILEASLQGMGQVVVDITSRFEFESAVLEKRRERELSQAEMCETMLTAQKNTYGDGLEETALHPYMWAVKGHYYGSSFYNYPYMFGLLFATGLYAQYQAQPDGFHERYDDLLSATGMNDAQTLGQRFGIDLRDEAFWAASLAIIRDDIDLFETLARGA